MVFCLSEREKLLGVSALQSKTIDEAVAGAMRWAREYCALTPEQFARELNRIVPEYRLGAADVEAMENARALVDSRHLVAAARIAGQPVSVALGELDLYEVTIPQLEARLAAVEDELEQSRS